MEIVAAPPPLTPAAGTLLAAAYTPQELLARNVEAGYRAAACGGWRLLDPCGTDQADHGFDDGSGDEVSAMPFTVQVEEECSSFGFPAAEYVARATARLASIESAAIAHEFWTGELAAAAGHAMNPRLEAGGAVTDHTPGAGAVSLLRGLAILEQALAEMLDGPPGAIHGSPETVTMLFHAAGLRREGNLILTALDSRVIGDAGYPGTSPAGAAAAAGEAWLYATARPTVRRSAVVVTPGSLAEALDKQVNTVRYSAERDAVVHLACGVHAVRVTLT